MHRSKKSTLVANLLFLISCAVAAGLVLFASETFTLNDSHLLNHDLRTFNRNWYVVTDEGRIAMSSIPRAMTAQEGTLTMENQLPIISGFDQALCFRSNNEDVRVSVGDKLIYTYGLHDETSFGNYFGNVWCMIPLNESYSGKKITIELTARCNSTGSGNYAFYLDHRSAIVYRMVLSNLFLLCNCLVGVLVGVALILSGLYRLSRRAGFSYARLYLGVCMILTVIWSFTYANLSQMLFHKKAVGYLLNYFSLYLLPIPFSLLMSFLLPRHAIRYRWMAGFWSVLFLLLTTLYVTGVIELETPLRLVHTLIALMALEMLITCIFNRDSRASRILLTGMGIFGIFTLISLGWFYLASAKKIATFSMNDLLMAGIDCLAILFYAAIVRNNARATRYAEHFERQAYTDALTQVGNRAAFELRMDGMEKQAGRALTLFMVDLNNLKTVNDTLGHESGDRLICDVVDCLQRAFGESGEVYRYGGDEFVVLMDGAGEAQARSAQESLDQTLRDHNRVSDCKIDVAVGSASRPAGEQPTQSPRALLHQADANMYAAKVRHKAKSSDRSASSQPLREMVDPVTGLMPFQAFLQRIAGRLARRCDEPLAIVSFDLNHFDGYNSLFGWQAGNQLLGQLATMALDLCGPEDFCAHGDADVFWVLARYDNPQELFARIRQQTQAFDAARNQIKLFLSFGIYVIEDRDLTVNEMCYRATLARRSIKGQFDRLYALYDTEQHARQTAQMRLVGQMHASLARDEFQPYYQPQFSVDGKTLVGAEALVRWTHPDGSVTLPLDFIDLFENSGLLLSLDRYMFERVCRAQRRRLDQGIPCVPVSVNLSRMHAYSTGAAADFRAILDQYGIAPELVCLELTETAFVTETGRTTAFVDDLRAQGFKIAMDDFGSGHSSLGQLSQLNVDSVKFDRSFLSGSLASALAGDILRCMIDVCRRSGIQTIAEGVETPAQLQTLVDYGCDAIQGELFSGALTEPCFDQLLIRTGASEKSSAADNASNFS